MKIIFFGTPDFAIPSLKVLIQSEYEILKVITQPDKKKGRGRKLLPPPVKNLALINSIDVLQPDKIKDKSFIESLRLLKPDLIVVAAYGRILPHEIIELPEKGCINVHASLLPKYRGAAPINWTIINGEKETGICTMLMDEGLDTGNILICRKTDIFNDDTCETLGKRLSELGAEILIETIDRIKKGDIISIPQLGSPTYARPLNKEDSLIVWSKTAKEIYNLIRGIYPSPGAYTFINGERVKITKASYVVGKEDIGKVVKQDDSGFFIGTSDGVLSILELQPAGKKPMSYKSFLHGRVKDRKDFLNVS